METLREKKIFILSKLDKLNTYIHPIPTDKFSDLIFSETNIPAYDLPVIIELIDKENLIEFGKPSAKNLVVTIKITAKGLEYLELEKEKEEEYKYKRLMEKIALETNAQIGILTFWASMAAVGLLIVEILTYIYDKH